MLLEVLQAKATQNKRIVDFCALSHSRGQLYVRSVRLYYSLIS